MSPGIIPSENSCIPTSYRRGSREVRLHRPREIQLSILSRYEGDFGKHMGAVELPRIRMVWNAVPMQLAKENRKFLFGQVKKGARRKDFETAIQWLADAGPVHKVHKVEKPAMPLKAYVDYSAFKIFFPDIGLRGAAGEPDPYSVVRGFAELIKKS